MVAYKALFLAAAPGGLVVGHGFVRRLPFACCMLIRRSHILSVVIIAIPTPHFCLFRLQTSRRLRLAL